MFIPKCKKCGGKVISTYTNIEIESNGVLKTVTNTPAKKCSKCGHIIVDDITMEKAKQYVVLCQDLAQIKMRNFSSS